MSAWADSQVLARRIGGELRRRRERAGLTQTELAARCDVQPSEISRLESGRRVPTVGALARVLDGLDTRASLFWAAIERRVR